MQNNFLDSEDFPRARALVKLAWLASTRDEVAMMQDPHVQAVMKNPKAQALFTPEVLAAIGNKDFVALLGNAALWDFLDEPDVQEHLNAIEWVEPEAAPAAGGSAPTTAPVEGPLHP